VSVKFIIMSLLIAGDSLVNYFHTISQVRKAAKIVPHSGIRVEEMWDNIGQA
jgi:hypothetical protein